MKVENMNELKHPGGRPRRPVGLAEAGRLLAEGHSLRATARRMGVGYGTIHKSVQDAGGPSALIENSRAVAS